MTDYGHELLFGAFITPAARPPTHAVELAVAAERAGLDLVTFQDHPYQPAFLDTWTLLSYVAARTRRVRLSGNVINLPLRHPAVLARAAASLDLLSGGRFELGIGAGGFWDAIAAMGGPRRSPGQAVEALGEAIEIIRELWATEKRGGVHFDGEHYRLEGAKRGPAPAHGVGIWVGAYKPRMLRLTGRVADGWLPSLPYLPGGPAALAEMNRRIDEGAASAGRDPSAVRRLLNIPEHSLSVGRPRRWAGELAELSLEYGVSGFILMTDDVASLELFAAEVAPATRELVAAGRAR
ncbi:N5,N10-methylene tetrahydromethanopterin reductase [Rubrobacter xylanophilus]|uniref:N5,N10-methylene tetrahydromethanopterin reductase n=1 Tax=Rubrobacter xylanophilus TaxID=49319 RepID=A0A510HP97_9ACTN|nr:LLM class flavin-dependent oxidoreductase [Rubrobacter xylanophilus]BBL80653.1 N5,N10-methylene tetrahydromethanopterin reductase [Rubrobacter xylanophilus]